MTATYYYVYPFGENADDLVEIPTSAAVDGSISYYAGYTDPYEYDLLTNPNALPVVRGSFNQLMFQATQNIQQYQQYGTPNWITSADNLGSAFEYPIYARVYYGDKVWENQVVDNDTTPGADDSWLEISGSGNGFVAGMMQDFAGPDAPDDWGFTDGTAYSRTDYSNLYTALTKVLTGTTTNGSAIVTGISSTAKLRPGCIIEGTGIPAATTILTVDSGTQITMSADATATGSPSLRFFYWGNGDGSTTFNVPNLQDQATAGAGGSGYTFGSGLGQSGGAQSENITVPMLPDHTHDKPDLAGVSGFTVHKSGGLDLGDGSTLGVAESSITGGVTGFTSQTAMPTVPPTTLVNKIIRLI